MSPLRRLGGPPPGGSGGPAADGLQPGGETVLSVSRAPAGRIWSMTAAWSCNTPSSFLWTTMRAGTRW